MKKIENIPGSGIVIEEKISVNKPRSPQTGFLKKLRTGQLGLYITTLVFEFLIAILATIAMAWFVVNADKENIEVKMTDGKYYNIYTMTGLITAAAALAWFGLILSAAFFYRSVNMWKATNGSYVRHASLDLIFVFVIYIAALIVAQGTFDATSHRIDRDLTKENIDNAKTMLGVFTATVVFLALNFFATIGTLSLEGVIYHKSKKNRYY